VGALSRSFLSANDGVEFLRVECLQRFGTHVSGGGQFTERMQHFALGVCKEYKRAVVTTLRPVLPFDLDAGLSGGLGEGAGG
jgi:hypothetical protein